LPLALPYGVPQLPRLRCWLKSALLPHAQVERAPVLMLILWSLLVVAGLLMLVYLMIAGVPRPDGAGDQARKPRLLFPIAGAFCTAVGIAGYLSQESVHLSESWRIVIVLATGVGAACLTGWTVIKVFATPSAGPEDDPRYRFQGQVATVTEAIQVNRPGRVVFQIDGQRYDLRAQSLDQTPVPANTEVVIEQIDDGMAIVELWASVEQRL